ncbi:MAG: protein kinase domain-containing protein, partial [Gemmata sp.]
MPSLAELGGVLIECRVVSRARWDRAARAGRGDPEATLDALAEGAPDWFADDAGAEPPAGLTGYQRGAIEAWLQGGEDPLPRQLAINQFLLLEKLGAGGQGEVYRGRQLNPPRFVAVKTLLRDTEAGRARFEREARAMMRVQHPRVARFYLYERVRDEYNRPTDEYLIAMEFVAGTDLHRLVKWAGPVPWPFVVKWAVDALDGLQSIHANGFIHRDV